MRLGRRSGRGYVGERVEGILCDGDGEGEVVRKKAMLEEELYLISC